MGNHGTRWSLKAALGLAGIVVVLGCDRVLAWIQPPVPYQYHHPAAATSISTRLYNSNNNNNENAGSKDAAQVAVEQIDINSEKVLKTFPSLKDAAAEFQIYPSYIKRVLDNKRKSCAGYFWRWEGSTALPRENVEKVSLETGQVLEFFPTLGSAGLQGGKLPTIVGEFLFRPRGSNETNVTYRSKKRSNARQVEKICLETNQVLETYRCASDAAIAMSTSVHNLYSVLQGRTKTCRGYFWRYVGSNALPHANASKYAGKGLNKWKDSATPVEQICHYSGRVLAVYESQQEAAQTVKGNHCCIMKVIRGEVGSHAGYFWRLQGSSDLPPKPKRWKRKWANNSAHH